MARCKGFRYPRRTRLRALEIFCRADCDRSPGEIAADLRMEGCGDVSENAIARWLREDPAYPAIKALALCQHLRRQAATHGDRDTFYRIAAAVSEVVDLLNLASKRASEALPRMELETSDDLSHVTATCKHLVLAGLESQRLVADLRDRMPAESFISPCGHA